MPANILGSCNSAEGKDYAFSWYWVKLNPTCLLAESVDVAGILKLHS